jgi:hypothetical protein
MPKGAPAMSRPRSTLEKLIAETSEHISRLSEDPEAYFFLTYANGQFVVSSAAVASEPRAMDIIDLLSDALANDPCVELEGADIEFEAGYPISETIH